MFQRIVLRSEMNRLTKLTCILIGRRTKSPVQALSEVIFSAGETLLLHDTPSKSGIGSPISR